ncbi:amidohydrolase family protein [Aureimonas leprariae]|uniref:Amidohydrolase family protein n=1 Tax=Plantimonas leprariae TaxID=2615207 RepID=A0A7V7PK45_9HYPH|nr:amidohydrolase family protein [Aureimonas leprariae]KAB0675991.1 amidohydrolase family protein [Aureimonas leprariae]
MTAPVIDAHQHFWDPDRGDFGWLDGPFQPIRRVFGVAYLEPLAREAGVERTVLVQVQNAAAETREFLEIAGSHELVAGVVGWADLTDPGVGDTLAELRAGPNGRWLVGIRHLIHEEPDDEWLLRDDVRRGLAAVADSGLVFDLVPKVRHLPAVLRTVADFPNLRFVLDHIAKPDIAHGGFEPWAAPMREFAPHRDHVWCKLSGMVTEADWANWRLADLKPYVDEALRIFGVERAMFGTDWPVCLVAASYAQVKAALEECLADRSEADRERIFGRNAVEAYRLPGLVSA